MTDRDHERMNSREEDDATLDFLDGELDAALAKYAAVEPRAGLSARVLANLQAEQSRTPVRHWWWSAAVVALVVTVALVWRWGKPSGPIVILGPANTAHEQMKQFVSNGTSGGSQRSNPGRRRIRQASPVVAEAASPKLDRFPSPQPLSEQERMLASYVAKYPERSVLIARARSEALRQDLEEMKALSSDFKPTDSDYRNGSTRER